MRKLLLLLAITFTVLNCSKEDDIREECKCTGLFTVVNEQGIYWAEDVNCETGEPTLSMGNANMVFVGCDE